MKKISLLAAVLAFQAACVPEGVPYPPPPHDDRSAACTFEHAPVCGERHGQRETYGNACMMRATGARLVHQGQCRPAAISPRPPGGGDQICTREYRPVCAISIGQAPQTFPNACVAQSGPARILYEGECRTGGTSPPPAQACTREYTPVCAVRRDERRSFANACEAEAAHFRVVLRGECRG